jgi:hypothetical protein
MVICPKTNAAILANEFFDKIFSEQPSSEPKVKIFVPLYLPFKTETCSKCGQVIAKEKELIRIVPQSVADDINRKNP